MVLLPLTASSPLCTVASQQDTMHLAPTNLLTTTTPFPQPRRLGLGLTGAAYAYGCCHLTSVTLLSSYVAYRSISMKGQPGNTWGGFSKKAFSGWGEYLSYGVPTAVMICMEWWAYEVLILLAGALPSAQVSLAVMGICLNISTWWVPAGLPACMYAWVPVCCACYMCGACGSCLAVCGVVMLHFPSSHLAHPAPCSQPCPCKQSLLPTHPFLLPSLQGVHAAHGPGQCCQHVGVQLPRGGQGAGCTQHVQVWHGAGGAAADHHRRQPGAGGQARGAGGQRKLGAYLCMCVWVAVALLRMQRCLLASARPAACCTMQHSMWLHCAALGAVLCHLAAPPLAAAQQARAAASMHLGATLTPGTNPSG